MEKWKKAKAVVHFFKDPDSNLFYNSEHFLGIDYGIGTAFGMIGTLNRIGWHERPDSLVKVVRNIQFWRKQE